MKKITAIILIAALILCVAGCETTVEADEVEIFTESNGYISVMVDKETGVNYIFYQDATGYSGGAAICPRYKPDGTLYVSEVGK